MKILTAGLCLGGLMSAQAALTVIDPSIAAESRVRIISETDRELVVEFEFGAVVVDSSAGFVQTSVAGCGQTTRPGWPELPSQSVWLRVPGNLPELSLLDIRTESHHWGLPQAAPDVVDRSAVQISRNPAGEFYQSTQTYPEQAAVISLRGDAGGEQIVLLTFHPLRYTAGSDEWTVHSRIVVRLRFDARAGLDRERIGEWTKSKYVARAVLNPAGSDHGRAAQGARMLVVTIPEFMPALGEWLAWKSNSGVPCATIDYASVADNADQLRQHIRFVCDSLETRPEFLWIVGDVDLIPAFFGVDGSLTDHPYSLLESDDFMADISVGRLPVRSAVECANWIARAAAYERDGILPSSLSATVFSSASASDPAHGRSMSLLLSGRGITVNALQEPQSGSLPQLMNSLAQSPAWVFYIGHGNAQNWSSVEPIFDMGAAGDAVQCGQAIVVSVACATADIDYPGSCIGEAWLLGNSSGPLAYVGATEPTAFFRSDTVGLGLMRGVFSEQIDRIGPALDYGKLRLLQAFPQQAGGLTEETMQQFCLLGDPSMRVYSSAPRRSVVSLPGAIPVDTRSISVTVTANGRAVSGAEVCLRDLNSSLHEIAVTNALGQAGFTVSFAAPTVVDWTVTGMNLLPAHGSLYVVPGSGFFLQPVAVELSDTDGDGDGLADRGEAGFGALKVVNLGNDVSPGGTVQMTTDSDLLAIESVPSELPEIAAGDTILIDHALQFSVSDLCADNDVGFLSVHMRVNGDSLPIVTLPQVVHAPVVFYAGSSLSEDSGNGDGRADPGERLQLTLRFMNTGGDALRDFQAQLSSVSQGVEPEMESCVTARCGSGDSLECHFTLRAAVGIERGYPLDFVCEYSAANVGGGMVQDRQRIGMTPVLLYVLDRNPADVGPLADALSALGVEHQQVTTLPEDLSRFESVWIFSGIFPNQTPVSYAAANRIADFLDQGGRCYWQGGDVWAFDIRTRLHSYFHIRGEEDGTADAGPVAGEFGTVMQDYMFQYAGENSFIDQLGVEDGSQVMLRNARAGHDYPVCISYASPLYRTVGASIELGSLADGVYPSTRVRLVNDILNWFGIPAQADIFPPQIAHVPVQVVHGERVPVRIIADIQDASGVASATVSYRFGDGEPHSLRMEAVAGHYLALIPFAENGTTVSYQISAQDSSLERNVALSPEYSYTVSGDGGVALNLEFAGLDPHNVSAGIEQSGNAGWAVTDYAERSCLELYASDGAGASYCTPVFRVTNMSNPGVGFWCSVAGTENTSLVVRGSVDGGVTFDHDVWRYDPAEAGGLVEGAIYQSQQLWMMDQDSVVLRFAWSGKGNCRIASVNVRGETPPVERAARRLVIHPEDGRMVLNWAKSENALYYVVSASRIAGSNSELYPIAMTRDTLFIDPEANRYSTRLYVISAIMQEGFSAPSPHSQNGMQRVSPRADDMRWLEKRARKSQ